MNISVQLWRKRLFSPIFHEVNCTEIMKLLVYYDNHITPFFRMEIKPEVPCRKILRNVKELLKSH
jgi:hypothetical protein